MLFETLHAANLARWEPTIVEDRARVGMHPERGPESLGPFFPPDRGARPVLASTGRRRALEAVHDLRLRTGPDPRGATFLLRSSGRGTRFATEPRSSSGRAEGPPG